jgi:hypothetical protein
MGKTAGRKRSAARRENTNHLIDCLKTWLSDRQLAQVMDFADTLPLPERDVFLHALAGDLQAGKLTLAETHDLTAETFITKAAVVGEFPKPDNFYPVLSEKPRKAGWQEREVLPIILELWPTFRRGELPAGSGRNEFVRKVQDTYASRHVSRTVARNTILRVGGLLPRR